MNGSLSVKIIPTSFAQSDGLFFIPITAPDICGESKVTPVDFQISDNIFSLDLIIILFSMNSVMEEEKFSRYFLDRTG